MSTIKILTYNIHKGYSLSSRRFVLDLIRTSIRQVHAELVFLQEVSGIHHSHDSQFEFLADETWSHFAYGKNAVYTQGHHGNALLSKYPIHSSRNEDISLSKIERRGILYSVIEIPGHALPLHAFCVHFGLFERDRVAQMKKLGVMIDQCVDPKAPLVIAGDFNDWREKSNHHLVVQHKLKEAFHEKTGSHALTFPNKFPILSLDRIYYRNLKCKTAKAMKSGVWKTLSDHIPLIAEFEL